LCRLYEAAAHFGIDPHVMTEVLDAAWNVAHRFDAHSVKGYDDVVEFAKQVNGWWWTDDVLIDPHRRGVLFDGHRAKAYRYANTHFARLPLHTRTAAVDDALMRVSTPIETIPGTEFQISGWDRMGSVYNYTRWELLDAARKYDHERVDPRGNVTVSWDQVVDLGEQATEGIGCLPSLGAVEDQGIEAVMWCDAHDLLDSQHQTLLEKSRKGPSRDRVDLAVRSALWVLRGGADCEAIRHAYVVDPKLVCFQGLGAATPDTWGRYPGDEVPTCETLVQAAADAVDRNDSNVGFFKAVAGRRQELNASDRILHQIVRLVEEILAAAKTNHA
jgi:hypothetical protein